MVPARPAKVLEEVSDQGKEWGEALEWEQEGIVSAPNAAPKNHIPVVYPAIP
jgi:hypothetical protein